MSQVQVVRGQTRASVMRKLQPLLAQGWVVQGAIAQETGWANSIRYAATVVFNPSFDRPAADPTPFVPPGSTLAWAVDEIQKLQAHCRSLEVRLRRVEAGSTVDQTPG